MQQRCGIAAEMTSLYCTKLVIGDTPYRREII
jgi:hypothetical protein